MSVEQWSGLGLGGSVGRDLRREVRSVIQYLHCMRVSKNWLAEEDRALLELHVARGHRSWSRINKILAQEFKITNKTPKICRERFINHLDPALSRHPWTPHEEHTLLALHERLGSRWADIARQLPGRTDNSVKNKFFSKYRRAIRNVNLFLENYSCFKIRELKISFVYKLLNFLQGSQRQDPRNEGDLTEKARAIKNDIITFELMEFSDAKTADYNKMKIEELVARVQEFNTHFKRKANRNKLVKSSKIEKQALKIEEEEQLPLQHLAKHSSQNDTAPSLPARQDPAPNPPASALPTPAASAALLPSPRKPPEAEYQSHLFSGICAENEDNFWSLQVLEPCIFL